ncbi:hypothetical protein ACVIYL_008874 [Bradyrhizobium sp. USDA 3315]
MQLPPTTRAGRNGSNQKAGSEPELDGFAHGREGGRTT